jgi:hypothetical protein
MLLNATRSLDEVKQRLYDMENARTKKMSAREHLNTMRYFRDHQHIRQINQTQRERFDHWAQNM